MSVSELVEQLFVLQRAAEDAVDQLFDAEEKYRNAEHAYKLARAKVILEIKARKQYDRTDPNMDEADAEALSRTATLRQRAGITEGLREAALENVRTRRASLTAQQTALNALRAEIELAGGPAMP